MTSEVTYQGSLRTSALHLASNNQIITDAPIDNHGKGEAFSPTDLTATSLATCMMTIMGIAAEGRGWDLTGTKAQVLKVMAANPRRISRVEIHLKMSHPDLDESDQKILEKAGRTCPVALSLHPDIEQVITFEW
jgi:putative redox protein